MRVAALFLLFSLLRAAPAGAAEDSFAPELAAARAAPSDLDVRPERWDTRSKLSLPESLLKDPLAAAAVSDRLSSALEKPGGSYSLVVEAAALVDVDASSQPPRQGVAPRGLPKALAGPVSELEAALRQAGPFLTRAVASLPEDRRAAVLGDVEAILDNSDQDSGNAATFDSADVFDSTDLFKAAAILTRAADAALPKLSRASLPADYEKRWSEPFGGVLISGVKDAAFAAKDLENTSLMIHIGRSSRYEGPLAAASTGQMRLVIDLSPEVSVEASSGRVASGILGIGLLYLPGPGPKSLAAGDFSGGAGVFGVGGLFLSGSASVKTGSFSQGAGAYGAGLFSVTGDGAALAADYAAQGFGFTRGAGLFVDRGSGGALSCGFAFPDPREDKGATSLCQGMGLGQRAFAAGGVGVAYVAGSSNSLDSSYFAQGSGYWHGLGALLLRGDDNRLKARRYDQGAGIHIAAGLLSIQGDRNALVNWGVGPGYGWDYGVGSFSLQGDSNTLYAEWGSGHGDINGRALSAIIGNGNLIELPDFGSGAFKREAPSYGLARIAGQGNRVRVAELPRTSLGPLILSFDPWGAQGIGAGTLLDPDLSLPKEEWPPIPRALRARREESDAARGLAAAQNASPAGRLKAELSAAAAFTTDPVTPQQAQRLLFAAPREDAAAAVSLVSSDYYDQFLWLRTLIAVLGEPAERSVEDALTSARGTRKVMLVSLLKFFPAQRACAAARAMLRDEDWRVRKEAAADLGYLFDREQGEEPGRLRLLETSRKLARRALKPGSRFEKAILTELGQKHLPELYAVLALDPGLPPQARLPLLDSADVVDPVPPDAARAFAAALRSRSAAFEKALTAESAAARTGLPAARAALLSAVKDSDAEVRAAALIGLGQIGDSRDGSVIAEGLAEPEAVVREAAAAALGKLGSRGKKAVFQALRDPSPGTRVLGALAAARGSSPTVLYGLSRAFADPDPLVRETALSALAAVQDPLRPRRKRFLKALTRLSREDPSPSVRAAAAVALARLR